MPYTVDIPLGWPYPKRKRFLDELQTQKSAKTYPLTFQKKNTYFPVYTVDTDLPKYRLANGRTQAAQEEYLAKHPEKGMDFFARDAESEEVQRVQHELLREMIKNPDLLSFFEDPSHSQEQPLILTDKGFVVNGNRRLCAMRELYYRDQEKYARYSHIDVVILPVCDEKDIDELEASLQIQPDIKQDYTWIAMACMLRARQMRYGYTDQQLSQLYDMPEREIRARLAHLDLVDEYLQSRKKAKQYDLVAKADYAFKALYKGRQQLKQADERDLFTQLAYCLIDDSNAAEGRLYERIPEVKDNLNLVADRLTAELHPQVDDPKATIDYGMFGVEEGESDLELLTRSVAKNENHALVVDTVVDVIEGEKAKQRQHTKASAVLKEISDANAHLKNAVNLFTHETSKTGIPEQLQTIEESIAAIRKWMADNA